MLVRAIRPPKPPGSRKDRGDKDEEWEAPTCFVLLGNREKVSLAGVLMIVLRAWR